MTARAYIAAFALAILLPAVTARAEDIVIGFSAPDTGPAATAALWQRWGVDIALDEINDAGGVLGRKLAILEYDNHCNPSEAVNVANRLVEAKVAAIIGSHCSSATLAAMPIIKDGKIPMVEGVATSPKITELSGIGGNEWMFRINPSDADMMAGLGRYLKEHTGFRKVAVIAEDTDFGRGGVGAFADVAKSDDVSILSTDYYPQGQPDFTSILTRVQQLRPDAIALFQLGGDQLHFAPAAVLRELPARLEARHRDREIDDAVEHLLDVFAPQRVELGQPLRVEAFDEAALRGELVRPFRNDLRHAVGVHRRVVPGRHALLLLVPARRHIGMGAGEDHQHLVVEEFLPLRVVLRHVHVDDDLLAVIMHGDRQVRGMQRPARSRDQHREVVRAHELQQLNSVFGLVVGR